MTDSSKDVVLRLIHAAESVIENEKCNTMDESWWTAPYRRLAKALTDARTCYLAQPSLQETDRKLVVYLRTALERIAKRAKHQPPSGLAVDHLVGYWQGRAEGICLEAQAALESLPNETTEKPADRKRNEKLRQVSLATLDAKLFGCGFVMLLPDNSFRHIPLDQIQIKPSLDEVKDILNKLQAADLHPGSRCDEKTVEEVVELLERLANPCNRVESNVCPKCDAVRKLGLTSCFEHRLHGHAALEK